MPERTLALFLPALGTGGAERVFVQLANSFASLGYRVDVVLATAAGPLTTDLSHDVSVIALRSSRVLYSLPKLIRYLRRNKPAAILSGLDTCNVVSVLASLAVKRHTRTVVSQRSMLSFAPTASLGERVAHRVVQLLTLLVYPFADHIICVSSQVSEDVRRRPFIKNERVSSILNPISIDDCRRRAHEAEGRAMHQSPFLLAVGSLSSYKGFDTLIRAYAIIAPTIRESLVILGEGPERTALEHLVAELSLTGRVLLPGFVRNPFPWFAQCSAFLLSSASDGCPNVILEALACGAPVVSTNCPGGAAELLQDGQLGELVPVSNPQAFASAIMRTLLDTRRPDATTFLATLSPSRVVERYLTVLLGLGSG